MSEQITLSDVRKWTDGRVGRMETAIDCIVACKENERPLGLIQHLRNMYAILQKAPKDCVQELDNEGWRDTTSLAGCRPLRYTYRLHPDVELIDDTAPESEYEFVKVDWINGAWRFWWNAELRLITEAPAYGSICIQAEDAEKRLCYIVAWDGQNTTWPFKTINDLIKRQGCFLPDSPLTPKAVVFRRGPHGSEK